MKSSSRLFPVQLLSAEAYGELTEDIYRIKPNNSPDKTVEIAVTRLTCREKISQGVIVLLHGLFQNRHFWFDSDRDGLAGSLARSGYDVWCMEARGHGLSPRNLHYLKTRLTDWAAYDIPAVNSFIVEQTSHQPVWLGYGEGGLSILISAAAGSLPLENIGGIAFTGPLITGDLSFGLGTRLSTLLPNRLVAHHKKGPEVETRRLLKHVAICNSWLHHPGETLGVKRWDRLKQAELPLFHLQLKGQRNHFPAKLRSLYKSQRIDKQAIPTDYLSKTRYLTAFPDVAVELQTFLFASESQ